MSDLARETKLAVRVVDTMTPDDLRNSVIEDFIEAYRNSPAFYREDMAAYPEDIDNDKPIMLW